MAEIIRKGPTHQNQAIGRLRRENERAMDIFDFEHPGNIRGGNTQYLGVLKLPQRIEVPFFVIAIKLGQALLQFTRNILFPALPDIDNRVQQLIKNNRILANMPGYPGACRAQVQ